MIFSCAKTITAMQFCVCGLFCLNMLAYVGSPNSSCVGMWLFKLLLFIKTGNKNEEQTYKTFYTYVKLWSVNEARHPKKMCLLGLNKLFSRT